MKKLIGLLVITAGFCHQAYSQPTLTTGSYTVDENTADGTLIGQVSATDGGYTTTLQLDAGTKDVSSWSTRGESYEQINFTTSFSETPIVFSQIQSTGDYQIIYSIDTYSYTGQTSKNGYEFIFRPRQKNTSTIGFEGILETDLQIGGGSVVTSIDSVGGPETVGWLAVSETTEGIWSGLPFEATQTGSTVTEAGTGVAFTGPFDDTPNVIASVATSNDTNQTGVGIGLLNENRIRVYMDELDDGDHVAEAVSLLMLQGSGILTDVNGAAIGETGSVTIADTSRGGAPTISLSGSYTRPVVFVQPADNDISDAVWRFTNISSDSFSGYLHDEIESSIASVHGNFELDYVVLEAGSWTVGITGGDESGAFTIDPETGEIRVADSTLLDFESGITQFELTIEVTDGTGQVTTQTLTISLNDVPDMINSDAQVIQGTASNDWSGWAVTGAGDVNGDGYDDIIVGVPQDDTKGTDSGGAYVLFGNSAGTLPDLGEVASGNNGFMINGASAGDKAGMGVGGGDDINGDGLDDIVVGAPYASVNGGESGAAYVVFGKTDTATVELSSIASDSDAGGFAMYGASSKDRVGGSVVVGDVNGDGLADITVGEFSQRDTVGVWSDGSASITEKNLAYTVYGKANGEAVSLADIAGSDNDGGFLVRDSWRTVPEDWPHGAAVLPVGDFNSDGLLDFVVNGGVYLPESLESNVLIFGRIGGELINNTQLSDGDTGITLIPESGLYGSGYKSSAGGLYANSYPGFTTSAVGDVNADGLDDIALMAVDAGCCSSLQYPTGYIVFGTTDKANINLPDIAAGNGGFAIHNDASGITFESSEVIFGAIGGLGDINGDGYDDIAIGDPHADSKNGRIYVVYGKADTTAVNLSEVVGGSGGFYTSGNVGDGLGHWIGRAGDVNGDGIADFLFGTPDADNNDLNNAGSFYLMTGSGDDVTHWGTAGDDTISGASNWPDSIAAGAGSDTINGYGGADVIYAGPGDDTVVVSDSLFVRIDGGNGTDTLQLEGAGLYLNLAAASSRVRSVEIIDIGGTGANAVSFNKSINGTTSVMVKGDADDKVYSTNQQWVSTAETEMVDGITYEIYSAGTARLLLQSGLSLTTNAAPTIAAQTFEIDEYSVGGTSLGIIDADANDIGDSVSFSVLSGNDKGFFNVDATTGELILSESVNRLDYESGATYNLTVQVTDIHGDEAQAVVTINVNDLSTITHDVSMDASGGGSIWADKGSLLGVFSGESDTLVQSATYDLGNVPGLPIESDVMDLSMAGTLGISAELDVQGGTVNADLPVDFSISYPDEVQPGGRMEIITSLAFKDSAKFTATSPAFKAAAHMSLTDYDFTLASNLPSAIDSGIGAYNLHTSGAYTDYSEVIESSSATATSTSSPDNSLRLEATISLPDWVDKQVYASDTWVDSALALSGEKEGCKDEFFAPAGDDLYYKMGYSLLKSNLWATADLHQSFSVELTPVAVLTLEDGTQYTFDPRDNLIMTPQASQDSNGDGVIDATLEVALNPVFSNDTTFTAGLKVPFETAQVYYNIQEAICTTTNVYFYGQDGSYYQKNSYGPLYDTEFQMNVAETADGDWVQDVISYSLSSATYTTKLALDLCDGSGTACAESLNELPVASSVTAEGTPREGYTLVGSYTYSDSDGDAETGSTYQWNLAADLNGTASVAVGSGSSYTLSQGVGGNYLQFCVIPSDGAESGSQACSGWVYVEGQESSSLSAGFYKALYLNGSDEYARIPLNGTFNPANTSFTVETWVKVDALGGYRHVVQQLDSSGSGRTLLGFTDAGKIYTWLGGSGVNGSTSITEHAWNHLALTYDQATSTLRIYLNGELELETVRSVESTYGDLALGVNKNLNGNWLEGALDETRVWTEARTQEQIQQHMSLAMSPNEPNLLFYYSYDKDDSATLTDSTANYYNATLYNEPGTIYSTDNSLSFDGNGDYVQVADDPELEFGSNSFSVEAWVYADPQISGSYYNIVGKKLGGHGAAGWLMRLTKIDSTYRPTFFIADGSNARWINGTTAVTPGTWNHIAATVDRSTDTTTVYLNGEVVMAGSTSTVGSVSSGTVLRIGAWSTLTHSYWMGDIDEVRIWNGVLTQAEIASNIHNRFDTPPANLAAYYTFENGEADDMSGNGHNGTLAGNTEPAQRGIGVAARGSYSVSGVLPVGIGGMCRIDATPLSGSVAVDENSGEFIYVPDDNLFTGGDSFSYYILDGDGSYSHSEKVSVTLE